VEQMTHQIKTHEDVFQARVNGLKPWEFRRNDRGYGVGHFLHEREVRSVVKDVPHTDKKAAVDLEYTGRELMSRIDYLLEGPRFGLPKGYCIMTLSGHSVPTRGGAGVMRKIMDAVEKVKDEVLPIPTYRTRVVKVKDPKDFAAKLLRGDVVVAGQASTSIGLVPGSEHEVTAIYGEVLVFKDGKRRLAEWFRPELRRRERVRVKVDIAAQQKMIEDFAHSRWQSFSTQIDGRIAKVKSEVAESEAAIQRAHNIMKMRNENLVRLEASKVGGEVWPAALAGKLLALVKSRLFANVEMVQEGERRVLVAYTGPMEVEAKPGVTRRGEYAIKVFPEGSPTRIVIENVGPGQVASDVPHNENTSGLCNVCFGDQRGEIQSIVDDEDWPRVLTMIRVYLEGNRK